MLCYQILHGRCDTIIASCFLHSTRSNQLKLYKCHCTVDVTKHYFANRVINVWNSLPDIVVTAPSLLSFRHQLAKIDLYSFCVNFYIYSVVLSLSIVLTVLSMYFIGVSGLRVHPLSINGMKWNYCMRYLFTHFVLVAISLVHNCMFGISVIC